MPSMTLIKPLGWAVFMSKGLKLPTDDSWKQPKNQGKEKHGDNFSLGLREKKKYMPWPPTTLPFFMPQHPNKNFQEVCDHSGKNFKQFHDDMIDAIKFGHDMWRLTSKLKDLTIMAVSAIGKPGCLKEQKKLKDWILMFPKVAAWQATKEHMWKWAEAVAKGVSEVFHAWQDKVTVPGLPWYPAFAAFPGPQAPPMPNVPMPVVLLVSAKVGDMLTPNKMKKAMINAHKSDMKDEDPDKQFEALFESVATVVSVGFALWILQQQVMLCLGKGPIPTFAPPYVPVGPVVKGDNIATPGHLAL